ncbi:ubiquinone biosynthesis O-methyltransferase [Aureobasidium pullulans]|nr:ubiquinone biosynthesis O-methyltransferase [Aureobasidium pullulans]THZ52357.1 ubiquinone biosynthesis O-methyltransferase [Aureobasidium pullulans]
MFMAALRTIRPTALPTGIRQLLTSPRIMSYSSPASSTPPPPPKSSVSETEMSHFSALASSWWDPEGPSRILHEMNPLRHVFIQRCRSLYPRDTTKPTPKLRYLDVGCGGGIFAESAARLIDTESVTAIDPTKEVLAVAKKHQKSDPLLCEPGRLNYVNTAIENLPLPVTPDQGVDVLSVFEVIEHVTHPAPFLANCMPHVKPGGWLVLSTISRTWASWFTTKLVAEDIMRIVPPGTHDWNQYINVDEMKAWAAKQPGWSNPMTMGVVYIPGYGWKEIQGSEGWGNYFFAIRKNA